MPDRRTGTLRVLPTRQASKPAMLSAGESPRALRYAALCPLMPRFANARLAALSVGYFCVGLLLSAWASAPLQASELRRTAIVKAVADVRAAIVNIHGEKTVDSNEVGLTEKRRVNGMGTGVVLDQRGYIITNHHVVDGVRKIMVTTASRETFVARLISHDPATDLAIIKIDAPQPLQTMNIGTSSDLMLGESVIAVGNAFGYEHTVTQGIISALNRTVQVSDAQSYEDLIQTDASINPGNSGGPLLNIDGEMIGVNVAVRAGAQGIGFAIPVDKVMSVAADLLSSRRLGNTWHGLAVDERLVADGFHVTVREVERDSPAASSGLQHGDELVSIGQQGICRSVDIERAMIDRTAGAEVDVTVRRNGENVTTTLVLASVPRTQTLVADQTWDQLGLKLDVMPNRQFQALRSRYRGGLSVVDVRADGPAAKQGIRRGDVLVGMHIWETLSMDNVSYILSRPDFTDLSPLKFYIIRGNETLYGNLTLGQRTLR